MRNLFPILAAAAFVLSAVAGGCGKEKSPPQPQPSRKGIAETGEDASSKPRVKLFAGTIEALDVVAGTLTLKGLKGEMRFQVREKVKVQLDDLKIGEKVIVKPRTSRNAMDRKEKVDAVREVGPVPQAEKK